MDSSKEIRCDKFWVLQQVFYYWYILRWIHTCFWSKYKTGSVSKVHYQFVWTDIMIYLTGIAKNDSFLETFTFLHSFNSKNCCQLQHSCNSLALAIQNFFNLLQQFPLLCVVEVFVQFQLHSCHRCIFFVVNSCLVAMLNICNSWSSFLYLHLSESPLQGNLQGRVWILVCVAVMSSLLRSKLFCGSASGGGRFLIYSASPRDIW